MPQVKIASQVTTLNLRWQQKVFEVLSGFLADWNATKLKFNWSKFSFKTRQSGHGGDSQNDLAQLCCSSCILWQNWRRARHGWWHGTANERRDYVERIDVHIDRSMTHTKLSACQNVVPKHVCHFIQDFLETHEQIALYIPFLSCVSTYSSCQHSVTLFCIFEHVRISYMFVPWPLDAGSPTSSPVRALAPQIPSNAKSANVTLISSVWPGMAVAC